MSTFSWTWCRSFAFLTLFAMACSSLADAAGDLPRVPDGFTIEIVAESPLVNYPMMAGFDDRGRLYVAESAGLNLKADELLKQRPNFIRRLEDTDGDGRFDRSTIFADKMTLPMGALWYRGGLYVASPPNIWRFEDTDDDGVADKRLLLVDTFGFSGNAASVHGCFLGPNGRLYWCDGRHGHKFTDDQGRVWSEGKAARIFSCRPDGQDVRVFSGGGMDNPVEIDFTPEGEMVGSVNILLSNPRVDCLVHWVDGGVYPRFDQPCVDEFIRTGDLLPPLARLGHVAVSGMTRYRSTSFGTDYCNNVFTTEFNAHKVVRSVLERSGATFRTREEDFLVSNDPDFHATDVLEDADGSLLVIDTGGWFRIGCPVSQVAKPDIHGAIYRIRRNGVKPVADPYGLRLKLEKRTCDELAKFLDDPRPVVRARVTDLLAERGLKSATTLAGVLTGSGSQARSEMARRNAVWALSRISPSSGSPSPLLWALQDKSESVRLAAARSVGMNRDGDAVQLLARLVVDDTPAVRRQAAAALGRICESAQTHDGGRIVAPSDSHQKALSPKGRQSSVDALFASLKKGVTDPFLEHALIRALIRIGQRTTTIHYLDDDNPIARRAALITLDQMDGGDLTRELVTPLLDTDDPALQKETLKVIAKHEGWTGETRKLLGSWMNAPQLTDSQVGSLRGFLLAQAHDAQIQELIAESLARDDLQLPLRLLLLEIIDRCAVPELPKSWIARLDVALTHQEASVRLQTVRIIQRRQMDRFDARLREMARDQRESAEVRIEALITIAPRTQKCADDLFTFLTDRITANEPPLRRLAAARALADMPLSDRQLVRLLESVRSAGPMVAPVLLRAYSKSTDEHVGLAVVATLKERTMPIIGPDELALLLKKFPKTVTTAAQPLLKRIGVNQEAQKSRLQDLASLLVDGDPKRGHDVFFGKTAACSSCHSIDGEGGLVGPNLSQIGVIRTGRDLLEAVVFPSATFARGFRPYTIVTDEGRIYSGIISRQTPDAIYLRTAELAELRIPQKAIEVIKESNTSIMPKGLDQTLSESELRDLFAYLQQRK